MSQYVLYRTKEPQRLMSSGMWGFMLIWLGQVVSLLGSGMTCFAQSIWVYTDVGQTIMHLTALAVLARLPGLLVSPLAGVLVDRWDRRWVMVISDAVAALATLVLRMLIVTENYQLWHIYVIVVVISIANHFQWPAYFAVIPQMVPKQHLGTANGLVEVGRSLGQIAAPFLAGVVVTLFKIEGVILFDMATYLFAFATLLVVRIPKHPAVVTNRAARTPLLSDIVYGWKYLVSHSGLVGLLVLFAASNFLLGAVNLLTKPLVLSVASATTLGSLMSIGGVSMLLGSLAMVIWGGPKRRIYGVLGFTLIQGIAIVIAGLGPSLYYLFSAAIVFYFAVPIVSACGGIIWQSKVAPDVQGRALAASGMISVGFMLLGTLIAGPLADHVFEPILAEGGDLAGNVGLIIGSGPGRGIGLMFIISGVLMVLLVIASFSVPSIRKMDDLLPDASFKDTALDAKEPKWATGASLFPGEIA